MSCVGEINYVKQRINGTVKKIDSNKIMVNGWVNGKKKKNVSVGLFMCSLYLYGCIIVH